MNHMSNYGLFLLGARHEGVVYTPPRSFQLEIGEEFLTNWFVNIECAAKGLWRGPRFKPCILLCDSEQVPYPLCAPVSSKVGTKSYLTVVRISGVNPGKDPS